MNNKKIILLLVTILMGLGLTASSAAPAYASAPYVDSDGIVRDYGQTNNGINLHQPLDRDMLSHTTALKQGAWRVYADPRFSKQDTKEIVKAVHSWARKGVPVYLSTAKDKTTTNIFIEKPSRKRANWMTKRKFLALATSYSDCVETELANYTKIALSTGYIRRKNDYVHNVLEHELGHAFGMMHSKNKHSVMYYCDNGNNKYQHITKQDVKVAKYLHKCLLNGNYYHEKTKPVIY